MTRPRKLKALLLLAPIFLATAACKATYPEAWLETKVPSNAETTVYEALHLSLERAGYPIGIGVNKSERTIETGWYTSLAPLKSKGFRARAHVTYAPIQDEGRYAINVRVERQTNESLRPLDPRYVKWEAAPDFESESRRILQFLRSYLSRDEIEIGPKPTRRFD